jgi:hypothetical protein
MTYQEEDRTRLKRHSSRQAITLAMQGRWKEAIAANKSLLESFPNDVDTYNRLGRAYMELGEYATSRESYKKALELDQYNTIAQKNLERLAHLRETKTKVVDNSDTVEPQQFIREVGKAGVINLWNLAPPEILAKTVAGDKVSLKVNGPGLRVENTQGEYIGQVDLKHGQRLSKLMEGGNKYSATILSSTPRAVSIITREIYQHPSQAGRLSFPPKGTENIRPYFNDRILRREIEYEETLAVEPTYTIIGGDLGEELYTEESDNDDDDSEDEE